MHGSASDVRSPRSAPHRAFCSLSAVELCRSTSCTPAFDAPSKMVSWGRERDGVTIDEVEFSYEQALRRLRPRQPLASAVEPNLVQLTLVRLAEAAQANRTGRPT